MIRLFRIFVPAGTLALLVSEVLLITSAFVLASYVALEVDPTVFLLYGGGLAKLTPVIVAIVLGLHLQDLYSQIRVKSRVVLVQQLCLVMGGAFLLQGFTSYVDENLRLPVGIMMWGSLFTVIAVVAWRLAFSAFALRIMGRERLLMVGGSRLLEDIAAHIEEHPELGVEVVGYVDDSHETGSALPAAKALGPLAALMEIVRATEPNRIIVGMFDRRNRLPVADLLELRFAGYIVEEVGAAHERFCSRVCVSELRPSQLIFTGELGPRPRSVLYQTVWNSFVALTGLIVSSPMMLVTALAIRLDSKGPALYKQVRVGLNGELFTLYKFRSMRVDAEAQTGAVWASRNDPRVTRVGRIIRKLRVDEVPQLINVLKGEMSIVGPRPERPELVKKLSGIPFYRQRHCVRPGITGWAQINHRYGDTVEDTIKKLEYDLYYIKNMSLGLDTYIVFHTVKTMLLSRGAQ